MGLLGKLVVVLLAITVIGAVFLRANYLYVHDFDYTLRDLSLRDWVLGVLAVDAFLFLGSAINYADSRVP